MSAYVVSFLVFLGTAFALGLGLRVRPVRRGCGQCPSRTSGDCDPPPDVPQESR